MTRQACRLGRRPLLFLGEPTDPCGDQEPHDSPDGAFQEVDGWVSATFAVCVPEFMPETLTVQVPTPCDLSYALQCV